MRHFDMSMTHRTDSDFPIPWFGRSLVDEATRPLLDRRVEGKFGRWYDLPPVVWAENDCSPNSRYPAIVRELAKRLPIDSYGGCLRNVTDGRDYGDSEYHDRLIEPYKFLLVLEYATCDGFAQDKLMDALRAGIVPIVGGPRAAYANIAPSPNAFIYMDEFRTLDDLASYVKLAANDRSLYMTHLEYRNPNRTRTDEDKAWRRRWRSELPRGEWSGWCNLCETATRMHFATLRTAFDSQDAFVRAFRHRLTDQITWHDTDVRVPPSPYVIKFLKSVPDPDLDEDRAQLRAPYMVQQPDLSCENGKWAALDAQHKLEDERATIEREWLAKQSRSAPSAMLSSNNGTGNGDAA
ncbi:hypothetical protein BC828DRAFT_376093 [Blastocladiella britannica]|nr:hypothetical protein BC828DRAFT_376093 [Blastocladiella britannica]